ncbi:DUF759 family protein (plasmid) [Borreliella andersonii]|uniref:DUF759 family protein n=1 Tax=Borrelia andersonii TaxID=42109 RepID=A0ACD5G6I6_BORAD
MSDKFTIKFKGILDHAATKKAIEQDITKMEKYLKLKKSNLGSTKDIVKTHLSDKKKELSRQSKFESLRERVEKYRLAQTKKLMKQGMDFEKARKEAFKRSLMSDRDKRRLEYKEIAKESKAKSKMLATSQGKGLVAKIAIGSALGNIISNAMSKASGSVFNFAKKAALEKSEQNKNMLITDKIFKKEEKKDIKNMLKGIKTFESEKEQEDFLVKSGVLKSILKNLGFTEKEDIQKAVELAANLKASGVTANSEDAIAIVKDLLSGNGEAIFDLMSQFEGFDKKYLEQIKMSWEQGSELDLGSRLRLLHQVTKDFQSLQLTKKTDPTDALKSNLSAAEDTLQNLTVKILNPILDFVNKVIKYFDGFTFETHILNPIIEGIKSIFNISSFINQLVQAISDWWYGRNTGKKENNNNQSSGEDDGTKIS